MITPDQVISYTSFRDFCTQVKKIAFPNGVAETRKTAFDNYLVTALIKAQKFVDCLRSIQVSFYFKNMVYDQCGMSTFMGPRGKINAIYAFDPAAPCDKYFYQGRTTQFLSCWSQDHACSWTNDPALQPYTLSSELCYPYYAEGTTEDDSTFKCCCDKYFARDPSGQLYLAPRFPCGYAVAVHWEGIRRHWNPLDAIVNDPELIDWVAATCLEEMLLRHEDNMTIAATTAAKANIKFADIMYWCNEERTAQAKIDCVSGIDPNNLGQIFQPVYDLPLTDAANPYA